MNNPKLLILSGMHGDEHEVIDCVKRFLGTHKNTLPEFLYIPEVSPSAVAQRTRMNVYGHDINRSFVSPPPDKEVAQSMSTLSKHTFILGLDFHEDPEMHNEFYMYDSGQLTGGQLELYYQTIRNAGALLYSGIDDSDDTTLRFTIKDGYISYKNDIAPTDTGFSSGWLLRHKIVQRKFTLEIPGKAPIELKQSLVNAVFTFFITPAFGF